MTNNKHRSHLRSLALLLGLSIGWSQPGFALEQKGVADIDYGRSLNREERQQALEQALQNAVETWVAEKQQSHYANYSQVKSTIDEKIREYVLSHQVISEDQDKKQRRYRVVVRAVLNEPKLLDTLLGPSATFADNAFMTFIFVAREQVGTVSQSEREATQEKSRRQAIDKERAEDGAAQTKTQTQTVSVRKTERAMRDRVLWDVTTSNEINVAMGEVFTDARYLIVDASLVEEQTGYKLSVEKFIDDYRTGNDVRPATKRDAFNGLAALRGTNDEIQYFAIGTLDVGAGDLDEKTGNYRVAVAVTGEVLSVLQRGAAVAKVGPETMLGEGPTELVAKNNALKAAAQRAARDLVAKLSGRNIR